MDHERLHCVSMKKRSAKPSISKPPIFLKELLQARSPSGYEDEAREVVRKRVAKIADNFEVDNLGNCHATLGLCGSPTLMLAGHIDELGLIIKHVSEKDFSILMQSEDMTVQ